MKTERLQKKIECTKRKINEIERIILILSPLIYNYKKRDIKFLEEKYMRLNYRLDLYKTKLQYYD